MLCSVDRMPQMLAGETEDDLIIGGYQTVHQRAKPRRGFHVRHALQLADVPTGLAYPINTRYPRRQKLPLGTSYYFLL